MRAAGHNMYPTRSAPFHHSRRVVLILYLLLLLPVAQNCMVFPIGERRIPLRIDQPPFANVQYELINWKLDRVGGTYLLAMLRGGFSGLSPRKGPMTGWHVDILLDPDPTREELATNFVEHPGRVSLYVVDDILFGRTLFIFPWIRRIDRRVSFTVWHDSRPIRTYSYDSDYYLVGGFSSFLALPFSERNYVRHDLARVARLFIEDAARDGLMGARESRVQVSGREAQ